MSLLSNNYRVFIRCMTNFQPDVFMGYAVEFLYTYQENMNLFDLAMKNFNLQLIKMVAV